MDEKKKYKKKEEEEKEKKRLIKRRKCYLGLIIMSDMVLVADFSFVFNITSINSIVLYH